MYPKNAAGEYYLPSAYIDAVRASGGVPILIPAGESNLSALLEILDGILLAGGGDIDPQIYGGRNHESVYGIDANRDRFELDLAIAALAQKIPTLGICRGLQVLNVAHGGTLIPHIPAHYGESVIHRLEAPIGCTQHQVLIEPNSLLHQALQVTETTITSWHHQAIAQVPSGWKVAATAPDGVIEAIEHSQHPWAVAVQWHPELSPNSVSQQSLFRAFIAAAS
jgi:putative glutamine amidotransferase